MGRTDDMRKKTRDALTIPGLTVEQAWLHDTPDTHQLVEDDDAVAITTKGARKHANEKELLEMGRRLLDGDWGIVQFEEDRDQNEMNRRQPRGILFGIYSAPDGQEIWATQSIRFLPPTLMLPEER